MDFLDRRRSGHHGRAWGWSRLQVSDSSSAPDAQFLTRASAASTSHIAGNSTRLRGLHGSVGERSSAQFGSVWHSSPRTQDFDHLCRRGGSFQVDLFPQERRWLARTACVKHIYLLRCLSIARVRICIVDRDDQPRG